MGENLIYYFLVKFADPAIIPDIHTVMFYNLFETAGGAYHHEDFAEHRAYLQGADVRGREGLVRAGDRVLGRVRQLGAAVLPALRPQPLARPRRDPQAPRARAARSISTSCSRPAGSGATGCTT